MQIGSRSVSEFVPDLLVALASGRPLATPARSIPELGCRRPQSRNLAVGSRLCSSAMGKAAICLTMNNGRCAQIPDIPRGLAEPVKAIPERKFPLD
jgi:hypothetical protein